MERVLAVGLIFLFASAGVVLLLQLTALVAHSKGMNPPVWTTYAGALSIPVRLIAGLIVLVISYFAEPFVSDWPFFEWLLGTSEAAQ